jgi:hypothetical protein
LKRERADRFFNNVYECERHVSPRTVSVSKLAEKLALANTKAIVFGLTIPDIWTQDLPHANEKNKPNVHFWNQKNNRVLWQG